MKMRRAFLLTLGLVIVLSFLETASASSLNPPDEVDESELEEVARPTRASSGTPVPRKRGKGRSRKNGENSSVSKRRLTVTARPTRAPLFEASPPDPFLEHGEVGPTVGAVDGYGHSHSPPTSDPYYSPKMYERERRRHKIKLAGERGLPQNSFDQGAAEPGKNYAFAYAVQDQADDFSHKQQKNNGVTVGEYRLTLPDGRTQVVRYTAGNKSGYKADVSYEPSGPSADVGSSNIPQTGGHLHQNGQYLQSVQPTHHLAATPSPSFQNNKVYKSRPLKNIALHSNEDIQYSPASGDDHEVHFHPTPKIRSKGGNRHPPKPTPTAEYLNGILSNPTTPRPNSIYDKISPYRGGAVKYSGSDELAHAHEQSPRAGPTRGKKHSKLIASTAASFFDTPSPSPHSPLAVLKESLHPTKKYKEPQNVFYASGVGGGQANHVNEYIHPQKHVQYLQENPLHQRHQQHHSAIVTKAVKNSGHHVIPIQHHPQVFKAGPVRNGPFAHSHGTLIAIPKKKIKKNKHRHGIHQPLGQYLLPSPYPVTIAHSTPHHHNIQNHITPFQQSVTPTIAAAPEITSTGPGPLPQLPFHYYNSLHHGHHTHLSASPTPVTSVTHHDSPFPLNQHQHHHLQSSIGVSGSGYLEPPPSGERPNRHGVKEVLSRLPSHDLATPKTTVHPYEVGSVDYGKSVAYGLVKPLDSKGFPEAHYGNAFPTGAGNLGHLDHSNNLFSSPGHGGHGNHGHQNTGVGYFPNDVDEHFNFLDGLGGFDIEQANVREIRQNQPVRGRQRNRKQPRRRGTTGLDRRRGVPAASSSESDEENKSKPSPTPSQPSRPRGRSSSPKPKPSQSTTQRSRGRRRKTQQPDPMMHAVETRRNRPRGRSSENKSK